MARIEPWFVKWEKVNDIGAGGQGRTLKVRSKTDASREAVVKILKNQKSEQARARMRREVVALDTLENLKVPKVLEQNTSEYKNLDVPLYFVIEFVPGRTLAEGISERGKQPVEKAISLILDLVATLAAAHEKDVYHRDLKPENIIVRNFDESDLVIVDYGISFNNGDEGGETELTHATETLGNPFLRLPETHTPGAYMRDPRIDITAGSGLLYFCLTGNAPRMLRDGNDRPVYRAPLRAALSGDPHLEQLDSMLGRGFNSDIENRFQTWGNSPRVFKPS